MQSLELDVEEYFLSGEHVCRHQEGTWNSVFSDQFGEQTYIRYRKAKGGGGGNWSYTVTRRSIYLGAVATHM